MVYICEKCGLRHDNIYRILTHAALICQTDRERLVVLTPNDSLKADLKDGECG